jgi:Carbamoyl-phosphate synthase L chain, ATP binding domain
VSVLILHGKGALAEFRYDQWLAGYDGEILLLCSGAELKRAGESLPPTRDVTGEGYDHAEAVDDYEVGGQVEARVLNLGRGHRVTRIIACQERDIERAAMFRSMFGLPGQTHPGELPFRNKILMKRAVMARGVPVTEHRPVECAADIYAFAEAYGFPVVIKPQDGAGSFGVRILRTRDSLERYLDEEFRYSEVTQPNLMAEAYVSETMYHVDGLVIDGNLVYAWPSRYMYALAVFEGDTAGRLDVTLDADDPVTGELVEMTERVLAALECPSSFPFHAEIFEAPDGRLIFNEIGARTGGAAQRDVQRALFGIDPTQWWVRAQAGLPLPDRPGPLRPELLTGQLALLKRPGTIRALPGSPPFPWVVKQTLFVSPGDVMRAAAFAADFMALFVITAPTREMSVSRMRTLEKWFLGELILESEGGGHDIPAA